MSIGDDFVTFNNPDDWELAFGKTFTAVQPTPNTWIPIGVVDLGVALNNPYMVVTVQVVDGKDTWRYGGEIRQVWDYPSGGAVGANLARATSEPTQLFINKPQIVRLVKHSIGMFRLQYHPPTWFKGVVIFGWKYVGEVENFTKDTLFELGNTIGIGTLDEPDSVVNRLNALDFKLNTVLELLQNGGTPPPPQGSLPIDSNQIDQINQAIQDNNQQVNQAIQDLANNLSDVLSGNADPSILTQEDIADISIEEDFI